MNVNDDSKENKFEDNNPIFEPPDQLDNETKDSGFQNHESTTAIEMERLGSEIRRECLQAIPIRYAGFWMRFWAYLLDLLVIGSIGRIIIKPVFRFIDLPLTDSGMFAPISIATALIFYAYFVLMTKRFGQTLGKMVFGLKVVTLDGRPLSWNTILFREWIGRFISTTILISYFIVAFLPKKQGLHDLFVDTTVIHH
jgi:uncharacterized RDD family membrane protein YckC